MSRANTLLVVVLMLSYGAVGARQPAVRAEAPLPVPAERIAAAMRLPSADRATLLLDVTRLVYGTDKLDDPRVRTLRSDLRTALWNRPEATEDTVPLPLDPSIWRDTILRQQVQNQVLVAAILNDRRAALMYHGLMALDDETLAWLGPDRDTLDALRDHAGTFAVFGRSIRVRAGRIMVPGGDDAEPLWEAVVGTTTSKTAGFVQHLFKDGHAAFMYDAIAHLDPARQRFALGLGLPESSRKDRFLALYDLFLKSAPEWRPDAMPFFRPLLDPGLVLATLKVTDAGRPVGPMARRLWDRVFRGDNTIDAPFSAVEAQEISSSDPAVPSDAATLVARVTRVPATIGRRRFDTMLFAQRVFPDGRDDDPAVATALRASVTYPALSLTLERMGVRDPALFVKAARQADAIDRIEGDAARHAALLQFQGALGILERIRRTGALSQERVEALAASLAAIDIAPDRAFDGGVVRWVQTVLAPALPDPPAEASNPIEERVIAAMAGVRAADGDRPTFEWEGGRYHVDPAAAELMRLRRVRAAQGDGSLDAAVNVSALADGDGTARRGERDAAVAAERTLGETLASLLYAAYLGDPSGPGVTAGNVALRHDLGLTIVTPGARSLEPWRLPGEDFSGRGWRVRGSLLGLDTALGRLALRRIDPTSMPEEPKLSPHQRVAIGVTAGLFNPFAMTDAARDEIAATLGRGRARVAALTSGDADIERIAREAGLSEWRRTALAWTIAHDPDAVPSRFSLLELFWLGAPRAALARSVNAWGATALPADGCLCLEMPAVRPWEEFAGRRASGLMASRAADVALRIADAFATLKVPSAIAPGVLGFALQDVAERARPAYEEDWQEFGRAARDLPLSRISDYVAAMTAGGPLLPIEGGH